MVGILEKIGAILLGIICAAMLVVNFGGEATEFGQTGTGKLDELRIELEAMD